MQVELTAAELKHIVRALIDKKAHLLNTLPKSDERDSVAIHKRADVLESLISKLSEEYSKV